MSIEKRKIREKEERRSYIFEKAKKLILERGVDRLTMQNIAEACELSKATLYLYFSSKEAILMEIVEEAASAFVEYARSHILAEYSGLRALQALWASYLQMFGESQDIVVLTGIKNYMDPEFPANDNPTGDRFEKVMGAMTSLIIEVLNRGIADGSIENAPVPERLAHIMITIATSIIDAEARLPRSRRNPRRISADMQEAFELILRGLAAEGSDQSLLSLGRKESETPLPQKPKSARY